MIHLRSLIDRFNEIYSRATAAGAAEPSAMALATVGLDGRPSVRMMLLKHADERGFVFYTNLDSRKGRDLEQFHWASACFWWEGIGEQVRIEGRVRPVSPEEADEYFASRPRGSQIGAWASRQSTPLASRQELLDKAAAVEKEYEGRQVPRPARWSGFRLVPDRLEFWTARPDRLHERTEFRLEGGRWVERILSP